MHYKSCWTYLGWRTLLSMCIFGLGLLAVLRVSATRNEAGPTPQQDVIRLEQRIGQLEQRLYSIDTSLRNLEQQSRLAGATSRGARQEDLGLLRSEIQLLQRQLAMHECGLAKLDERTLAPALRDARRKSGAGNDPCRVNVSAPLDLSE